MSRLGKFHLYNFRTTYIFTIITIVSLAGFILALSLFIPEGELTFGFIGYPIWLSAILLIITPIQFLTIIYAVYAGSLFFDTALRFGFSRIAYFISQMGMIILIAVTSVLTSAIVGDSWNGSLMDFVSMNFADTFTFENIAVEVLLITLVTIASVLFYRYGIKVLIPLIVVWFLLLTLPSMLYVASIPSEGIMYLIINLIEFVMEYKEIFAGLLLVGSIIFYYFLTTRMEVQD